MKLKGYKSSASRLARFFEQSRNKWRAHAAEKQKKLRALETRVRDLERSRAKWKGRALQAEQTLAEGEASKSAQGGGSQERDEEVLEGEYLARRGNVAAARGHHFDLEWMEWALLQLLVGLGSLRGACRMLAERSGLSEWGAKPAVSTVRSWLFRLGLGVLEQPVSRRDDWIVILDLTVELGTAKVLVIVGLPQERLQALRGREQGVCLAHRDVQCLALEVLEHSNGEAIAQCLERLSGRIGPIRQIVADHGSDVKSGIGRYRQRHEGVRFTYDVTHQVALWLEHALKEDAIYGGFRGHCVDSVRRLQQTALHFLKPPTPRSKARWQQMSELVSWAGKALAYYDRGQFTELAPGYRLDGQTQDRLRGVLNKVQRYRLNHRVWRDYDDEASYLEALWERRRSRPIAKRYATPVSWDDDSSRNIWVGCSTTVRRWTTIASAWRKWSGSSNGSSAMAYRPALLKPCAAKPHRQTPPFRTFASKCRLTLNAKAPGSTRAKSGWPPRMYWNRYSENTSCFLSAAR